MIEVLTDNHYEKILDQFDGAGHSINIVSPFLTKSMADKLCQIVSSRNIDCTFITRFYLQDMLAKANSIDALETMMNAGIGVYAVKGLHTKLYLFDQTSAVLGSANFTTSGLKTNIELSLMFKDEVSVQSELNNYFIELLSKIKENGDGLITNEMLEDARIRYKKLWSDNKGTVSTKSTMMYGTSLSHSIKYDSNTPTDVITKELDASKKDLDMIFDMFKETEVVNQIKYNHTIWLKFDGEGNDRLKADEGFPMVSVQINGKKVYLSNYPFKVGSIKDDDEIYLAALTTDQHGRNQPVIVGRGHLKGFSDSNHVEDNWCLSHDWMDRYPWYCIISDCEVLDTSVNNGIPMDTVWEALGSDTYIASFGRKESIADVAKKHYQKAHIRLSGNAKEYIDRQYDDLAKKYGVLHYNSEE